MAVVTNQPLQHSYFVQDITNALTTYNRLRWHRSRTGQYGVYEPVTDILPTAAVITGASATPHALNGKTLKFRVNGVADVAVTFADPDPVTTLQAATAINLATPLVVAADDGLGRLKLTTVTTGTGASIAIQDGDANPTLGFVEGDGAIGRDQDTILLPATHEYFYTDQNSDREYWYRVEFRHSTTGQSTGLGVPFPANQAQHVSKALTIVGYVRLADMSGIPISCRRVIFANPFIPNTVLDQGMRWGIFRHYHAVETDRNGYVEFRFIRGMKVDIAVEGTNFVRRIQIPTTGDVVDLLDPALVLEDEFGIQEPNIDFAVRLS